MELWKQVLELRRQLANFFSYDGGAFIQKASKEAELLVLAVSVKAAEEVWELMVGEFIAEEGELGGGKGGGEIGHYIS